MIAFTTLLNVGLEENEARLYAALVSLGETTIIPLAKAASLPRTTCYSVSERMAQKGLLSKTVRGAHTYFSAASPEKIRELAILNEKQAQDQRRLAEQLVPQLTRLANEAAGRPKIQYFSGREGVRAIFEDLLTSGEVKTYYIGSVRRCVEIAGEHFMKDWVRRRAAAGIFSYGVRIESEEELKTTFRSSRKRLRQVKFAPAGAQFPVYIAIYGSKVACITSKREGFGLIITSKDFAVTFKSMFNIIWSVSKLYREKG